MILLDDKAKVKLIRLVRAKRFLDQCKRDGDHAVATGALRDAREGLTEALDELEAHLPPEVVNANEW
jgi:hypothetical protein